MSLKMYKPAEAAHLMGASREQIDGACHSGALHAVDVWAHLRTKRKAWRIAETDLADWHARGRPPIPVPRI